MEDKCAFFWGPRILSDVEDCIRDHSGEIVNENLRLGLTFVENSTRFLQLRNPLWPVGEEIDPIDYDELSSIAIPLNRKVAENLQEAFGVRSPPAGRAHKVFINYANYACTRGDIHSWDFVPLSSSPHFFPVHLLADAPGSSAPRSESDFVDFAMRLWLFNRLCALQVLDRLLVHRVQLVQKFGVERAHRNSLVPLTDKALVSLPSAVSPLCSALLSSLAKQQPQPQH